MQEFRVVPVKGKGNVKTFVITHQQDFAQQQEDQRPRRQPRDTVDTVRTTPAQNSRVFIA